MRILSYVTSLFVLPAVNAARTPPPDAPCENPNRCEDCLIVDGGTPEHGFIPPSDSMFFDVSLCGACGQKTDVCDPPLLDAYLTAGLDVSGVPTDHWHQNDSPQLVRLRFRQNRNRSLSSHNQVVEVTTREDALARVDQHIRITQQTGAQ